MGYNPIKYRYITNKNHSEIGLMFLGHHPVDARISASGGLNTGEWGAIQS